MLDGGGRSNIPYLIGGFEAGRREGSVDRVEALELRHAPVLDAEARGDRRCARFMPGFGGAPDAALLDYDDTVARKQPQRCQAHTGALQPRAERVVSVPRSARPDDRDVGV